MKTTNKRRQNLRQAILIIMLLLFPVTMNYFSPYVIIDGAARGIAGGSLFVFAGLFVASLLLGRAWCGWACPVGALGEIAFAANNKPTRNKRIDWIKWVVFIPWIGLIVWLAAAAGGFHSADFFLDTVGGISVAGDADRPVVFAYVIYYMVTGTFLVLSLTVGRRAGCHAICWMAPFMIAGRKLRNLTGWTALRLQADAKACTRCKTCTTHCPMSLEVDRMVQQEAMEDSGCILCGSCVDGCPSKAIRFRFSAGK